MGDIQHSEREEGQADGGRLVPENAQPVHHIQRLVYGVHVQTLLLPDELLEVSPIRKAVPNQVSE